MDPINRLNRLMETLRQQMAQSAKRTSTPTPEAQKKDAQTASARGQRLTVPQLRQLIQERARAIPSDRPDRDKQLRRIFLESVLAWEFGEELVLDSQFSRLLENIQEAFEQDDDTNRELRNVLAELARG